MNEFIGIFIVAFRFYMLFGVFSDKKITKRVCLLEECAQYV